jgi:hypothetical protein
VDGCRVATHIAFCRWLSRLLPGIAALHYASWFPPRVIAVIAKVLLDRKYRLQPTGACVRSSASQLDYLL